MRKFKLQVQTSIDGYVAGPNWMTVPFSEDVYAYINASQSIALFGQTAN